MEDEIDVTLSKTSGISGENTVKLPEEPPKEVVKEEPKEEKKPINDPSEWLKAHHWVQNPFILNILPDLFVGYKTQAADLMRLIRENHKLLAIIGPTGSGKTTTLKWLSETLDKDYEFLYIGKPPEHAEEFVDIFNEKYPKFLFGRHIKNMYQIPNFLNKKLRSRHLVVLFDEAHESNIDVLEWLRVLSDQVENMSIVLSGLPVLDDHLAKLETLRKRIMGRIELVSLTKEETEQLIKKRIRNVGGIGEEFNDLIEAVYDRSGGFPREIIKVCNDVINEAMKGRPLTKELFVVEIPKEQLKVSLRFLEELTPMQREIVEMLAKPMTPGQIANNLDLTKYKSRQHAVRSMNNILKRLMDDGMVERVKEDRAYLYQLSPSIRSILVRA